ncbi:MAG: C40 family peptidase [Desulfobacteraceae bacterium]|nr:C40 family peptidase [Desulfobacteraceae bacterium]
MIKQNRALFLLIFLALTCLACAGRSSREPAAPLSAADLSVLTDTRRTIVQNAVESIGTPYHWGGHTPGRGFDCSGLVFYTHKIAGIQVPRTTRHQFKQGKKIPRYQLVPADLVFFLIPDKKTAFHVGIYVGENQFIHSPGRGKQVIRSHLDNPYFKKNYAGARSFL